VGLFSSHLDLTTQKPKTGKRKASGAGTYCSYAADSHVFFFPDFGIFNSPLIRRA
jgi:hypothetical protein